MKNKFCLYLILTSFLMSFEDDMHDFYLSNGLKVIIYKKICKKNDKDNCKVIQDNSTLGQEIKLAILQKAATIKNSEKLKFRTVELYDKKSNIISKNRTFNK